MAINRFTNPLEQSLESYVPLPFQEMAMAGQAIQARGDLAQQQVDQAQVGLASIAANPYHQDFISQYANKFKEEATGLLDKYQGNTSNPEFVRESKRLSMQFAADPRLKSIQQAKLEYDKKQAMKAELDAKGIKYVDTGSKYNGLDEKGQISANVGSLRSTDYDKVIADRIAQAAKGMEQRGELRSNQWNIEGTNKSLKQQIFTDPELTLGVQHLMQQRGISEADAVKTMSDYIDNVSKSMISSDVDHFYAEYEQEERFERGRRADAAANRAVARAGSQVAPPVSLGSYFVETKGEADKLGDNEIPLAGKSNVSFNRPFTGVLNGERFVFKDGRLNDEAEKKMGSVHIKDGVFVNVSVPYTINEITGSGAAKYVKQKGQILSKDTGMFTMFGSDGSSESTDILTEPKTERKFVYLDKARKVKGYLQPQAFGVYKDNESDATIYKKLNRDETLTYLGADAGKLSNDGYDRDIYNELDANNKALVLSSLKAKGYDISNLSPSKLNDLTRIEIDRAYYNQYKRPLFDKPATTDGLLDYYTGK